MSVSILAVDDEMDVADMRRGFRLLRCTELQGGGNRHPHKKPHLVVADGGGQEARRLGNRRSVDVSF